MAQETAENQAQEQVEKRGRKANLPINPPNPEELLDSLATIIIERILEESKSGKIPVKL